MSSSDSQIHEPACTSYCRVCKRARLYSQIHEPANLYLRPILNRVGQSSVGTCSPGQVDPTGKRKECKQSLTWDDNCSVNLASQGHCTRVFIDTRVSNVPRQGRLCPHVPGLSPEYSHKGGLQTVITEKLLQMRPVTCLSTRGPLQWAEFHVGLRAR
jgi:hypothetical protein